MDASFDRIESDLQAAWRRSDDLFALLRPEALLYQPIVWRHPFIFYLGHLPAFAWTQVHRGRPSANPYFDDIFSRGIDPDVDSGECHTHPEAPRRWPDTGAIARYRDDVRDSVLEALYGARAKPRDEERRRSFYITLEHELMHQETLLYMIYQLAPERKIRSRDFPEDIFDQAPASVEVTVPAGQARLGAPGDELEYGWDNEFEGATVYVPAFKIDSLPVKIGDYHEFVACGAYEDPRHWTDSDWAWKTRENLNHPNFWLRERGSWFYRSMFDILPLPAVFSWPVYTSLAEARAYARWKKKRLLTEAEYHRATFCRSDGSAAPYPWGEEAPTPRHGNFDFTHWSPVPVGSYPNGRSAWGIDELCGNGWEWTDTPFAPFPGFAPQATYSEYSADFFDGKHFVLKGASWATAARLIRPSFRNWYQAHYPYVFAKFRCASST
jgi:ergothioneine biosynthesis protein EgtB